MTQAYKNNETIVHAGAITNRFLRGVYNWMALGLALTAVTSWAVASSPAMLELIFGNSIMLIVLLAAQVGAVIAISAALPKLSRGVVTGLFIAYSILSGMTLSVVLLVYPMRVITVTFLVTAGTFGALSLYGLMTRRDLTSMGNLMSVGLFGIIIAMLVNFFLNSPALDYAISAVGVIVFMGLTAWDTQKLRNMGLSAPHDDALAIRRATIFGALTLYLDFINLFLFLLRLFGNRE